MFKLDKEFVAMGGMMVGSVILYQTCASFRAWAQDDHSLTCIAIGASLAGASILYEHIVAKNHPKPINEVKFVSFGNRACLGHIMGLRDCTERGNRADPTFTCSFGVMRWIIEVFDSAQETLDITINLITSKAMKEAIFRAHRRGVRVRMITDYVMSHAMGSVVLKCIYAGIPVRMHAKNVMHRKSMIIDNKFVFNGTGNWTMQAIAGNCETWLKTNEAPILETFIEAFDKQWVMQDILQPTAQEFKNMRAACAPVFKKN